MRKILSYIFFIISLSVLLIILLLFDRRPRLSDNVTSVEEIIADMSVRTLEPLLNPTIYFDEEELFYDEANHTFYYSVTEGSKSGMDPHVSLSTVRPDARYVFSSTITKELIANNVPILLSVYNTRGYELFYIRVTTLPIINIDCTDEISSHINSKMYFTLFDNSKSCARRLIESEGNIHTRGATSSMHPKRGYHISLKQYSPGESLRNNHVSLLGMRQDEDWLLYAIYSDPEKVRNVFSQNLWYESCNTDNRYRKTTGTQYRYVELFFNREYHGLYAICQPIDEKMLEFNGDLTQQVLYKYTNFTGDQPEISDRGTPYGVDIKHSSPMDDDPETDESYEYGKKEYRLLSKYLKYLNKHRDDNSLLAGGIDMDNAIDFQLFTNFTQGSDQVKEDTLKNVYLALFKEKDRIKALYCPWDLDLTWGDYWVGDIAPNMIAPYYLTPKDDFNLDCGYLPQMIKNDRENLTKALSDKYALLRANAWSDENILAMLDDYEARIFDSGAYRREMARWPEGTYEDPVLKLSVFKQYVFERIAVCDKTYGFTGGKQHE